MSDGHDEDGEAHDEVALRVLGRADVPSEHLDAPDLRDRAEVAREVRVGEDHLLDGEAQPEGHDGEVDAPRPQRRDREEHPDDDREHHTAEERELRGPVLVRDEAGREQRTQSADRVLGERELTRVAGEHHDRQDEDPDDHRRVQGRRPLGVEGEAVEQQHRADDRGEEPARDDTGAEVGELLEDVTPQRQRLAANDEDDDDHDERERALQSPSRRSRSRRCRPGTC